MKKIIIFQLFLLIIGKYFISDLSVKLPVGILGPFLPKGVSVKEVHWIKGKLILKNVFLKTDRYKISCPQANVLSYFPELLIQFPDASLQCPQANIFNIQGFLSKRGRSYRAIMSANSSNISKLNLVCDKLSLDNISFHLSEGSFKLPTFSLQQLDIHLTQNHALASLQGLKTEDAYIEKLQLNLSDKRNRYYGKFNINTVKYKTMDVEASFGRFQLPKDKLVLNNVVFYAKINHDNVKNIAILCNAPKISKTKLHSKIYAEHETFNAHIDSKNLFRGNVKCSHGFVKETLIKALWPEIKLPIELKAKDKLYFSVHGLKSDFNVSFSTKNIFFKEEYLSSAQGHVSVKDLNIISWNVNLQGENTNPTLSGQYDLNQKQGCLLCQGYIKPQLTYQLKEYLPRWWCSFFQNFHYKEKYPYADFQILFDLNSSTAVTFGNSYVHNCEYKSTHVDDLNVSFGNQPGFCQLTINTIKTAQNQQGRVQIDWPYDNSDAERWLFKGQGNFSIEKWRNLLENFIGPHKNFEAFDFFTANSIAKVKFNGLMAHQKDPKEYLKLHFEMPQIKFFAIPVKQLQFVYRWTPKKTSIHSIKASVWNKSPVAAQVDLTGKGFNFSFKGEKLNSAKILKHPFFKSWKESIPEENLETYNGIFDLYAKGQGEMSEALRLSGTGHVDFKNENLSQIHLLGPLSKLFSKRFKWQPKISFNQFISDFTFTEQSISSDKTTLLGPSTRADIHGNLDLIKQAISAQIHFSFLDYNQMKFPIMKHVVQIFQPLSKGFSASLSGTFKNPQWFLTFNPFRFVFKGK